MEPNYTIKINGYGLDFSCQTEDVTSTCLIMRLAINDCLGIIGDVEVPNLFNAIWDLDAFCIYELTLGDLVIQVRAH